MTEPHRPSPQTGVLVAFAAAGYLALLVAGLGLVALWLDDDVISTPGLGPLPGFLAPGCAIGAFAALLAGALRAARPSYLQVATIALVSGAVHALVLGVAGAVSGGLGAGTAAMAEVLTGWVSPVVAIAAAIASWAAIAMRRTEARRPRWPWEDDAGE